MNSLMQLKQTTSIFLLALAWFALSPQMQAAPDEGPQLPENFSGSNTFDGYHALLNQTANTFNSAFGWLSLTTQTTAEAVTGCGAGTLVFNTADNNTAVGAAGLEFNTTGTRNVALGGFALLHNTTGNDNTALGFQALQNTSTVGMNTGISNNAVGRQALFTNTTGSFNQAIGVNAMLRNTTGSGNIAIGDDAGTNINGTGNVTVGTGPFAVGLGITTGDNNTVVGDGSGTGITTASGNTVLGFNSATNGATGNDNVYIGRNIPGGDANTIRIADPSAGAAAAVACFVGGIRGVVPPAGSHGVVVAANGQLADVTASSRRFKKDITPIDKISEGVLALKPVTFHYKNDNTNEPEFGLVAEDVAEVNPDWITRDREGEIFGVRYEVIPIVLLNEFLKEHKKVEEQQASISQLKSEMQTMVAQLKEQAAQIQKVSAQLEVSKPAPQVVAKKP